MTGVVGEGREVNTVHLSFCKAFNGVSHSDLVSELRLLQLGWGHSQMGKDWRVCVLRGTLSVHSHAWWEDETVR